MQAPGGVRKGAAVLAEDNWKNLLYIDDFIHNQISPHAWPEHKGRPPSPLIMHAPFQPPQQLHLWLAQQACSLDAAERILYSSSSSQQAQDAAFEQLCQQHAALISAQEAMQISHNDWVDDDQPVSDDPASGPSRMPVDSELVLALHYAWIGYKPWTLSLPNSKSELETAQEVMEALLVRRYVLLTASCHQLATLQSYPHGHANSQCSCMPQ